MSYTNIFGGSPVQPADVGFRAFTIATNTALDWPQSNQETSNAAARIMEVTASASSLSLALPPADEVSVGMDVLVRNVGAQAFTVTDSAGASLISITPGVAIYLYVSDNSTAAGTWGQFTFGAGASAADAASLAGPGLAASGSQLVQDVNATTLIGDYTVTLADRNQAFLWNTGAGTMALPAVGSAGNGWFFYVRNIGTGALALDPNGSEQINGSTTAVLNPNDSCLVLCTGAAWYTYGLGKNVDFSVTLLNLSVAGSSDVTLTSSQAGNLIQRYFGILTGNINVKVPAAVAQYYIHNDTSGAYTLTVKTPAGTGVTITQGQRRIVYCDGSKVVLADDGTAAAAVTYPDGSAGTPSIAFTGHASDGIYSTGSGNLSVAISGSQVGSFGSTGLNVTGQVKENGVSVSAKQIAFALLFGG